LANAEKLLPEINDIAEVMFAEPTPEQAALNQRILDSEAFTGRWQTYLTGDRLVVPQAYHELLRYGGVIAPDQAGAGLLLFGMLHWQRVASVIAGQMGLDPAKHDVMARIYDHKHLIFKRLNDDGTITLSKELIDHAGLKKGAIVTGRIYYAYVAAPAYQHDTPATESDWANLGEALS
jgi:DNA-binding transcriptional regulator/RsmH inhibitor MraZ